jgi:hypothetical protein
MPRKPTKPTPKKGQKRAKNPPAPPAPDLKAWRERFLAALRASPNVSAAAKAARVNRQYVYEVRAEDAEFEKAWDDALLESIEVAEGEAYRRAVHGVKREKGIYYLGEKIATETVTEYSDTLIIFLLKAHKPKVYRETVAHEITRRRSAEEMTDDELAEIASRHGDGSGSGPRNPAAA